MNPYVFFVGCPRSGTTLLRRLTQAHSQLAVSPETHWIPRYYRRQQGVTAEGIVTPELVPTLVSYHRFSRMNIDPLQLKELTRGDLPVSYSQFVTGVFDLYGRLQQKALVGDKTPEYVREIDLLHQLWPKARFVHLIRDGRDVCLSATQWTKVANLKKRFETWAEEPVATAAGWWDWKVRLGREAGAALGPDLYYELQYEALVTFPEAECAKLCDFLGVEFDEAMLQFHEGRRRSDPGLSPKRAWLPVTQGLRNWRTEMAADQVSLFETVAGDLLSELGYPRACPRLPAHGGSLRSRIRNVFAAKNKPVPQWWDKS